MCYAELKNDNSASATNHLLGKVLASYIGHAVDYEIRWKGSSGGIITALLKHCFETGFIDAAIVTGADPVNPLISKPLVAYNANDVNVVCGARYSPSPVNRCIREAMNSRRIAVVGLPCHFESIVKAAKIFPELNRKIVLKLGLFCSHNLSVLATKFVCRHLRIPIEKISSLKYRGDGWPSGIRIQTLDGLKFYLPNQSSLWTAMFMAHIFTAPYCLLCTDHTSEFADISFGDAWLPEIIEKDNKGESIIISRTLAGEQLLSQLQKTNVLNISPLTTKKVIESQMWPLYFKKALIDSRLKILANRRFDVKSQLSKSTMLTKSEHRLARKACQNSITSCKPLLLTILSLLPARFIDRYCNQFNRQLWQNASAWLQKIEGEQYD